MKFKQSIAFAAIASSIITNSLCAYSEDNIIINEQTWSQNDKKAVISLDDKVVEIHENSDIAYINGEEIKIDSVAFNNNGTLFVPARFIFEAFGADVLWNAADKSISINFK